MLMQIHLALEPVLISQARQPFPELVLHDGSLSCIPLQPPLQMASMVSNKLCCGVRQPGSMLVPHLYSQDNRGTSHIGFPGGLNE